MRKLRPALRRRYSFRATGCGPSSQRPRSSASAFFSAAATSLRARASRRPANAAAVAGRARNPAEAMSTRFASQPLQFVLGDALQPARAPRCRRGARFRRAQEKSIALLRGPRAARSSAAARRRRRKLDARRQAAQERGGRGNRWFWVRDSILKAGKHGPASNHAFASSERLLGGLASPSSFGFGAAEQVQARRGARGGDVEQAPRLDVLGFAVELAHVFVERLLVAAGFVDRRKQQPAAGQRAARGTVHARPRAAAGRGRAR